MKQNIISTLSRKVLWLGDQNCAKERRDISCGEAINRESACKQNSLNGETKLDLYTFFFEMSSDITGRLCCPEDQLTSGSHAQLPASCASWVSRWMMSRRLCNLTNDLTWFLFFPLLSFCIISVKAAFLTSLFLCSRLCKRRKEKKKKCHEDTDPCCRRACWEIILSTHEAVIF